MSLGGIGKNGKMRKRDIANQVYIQIELTPKEAEYAVETLLNEMKTALASGESVSIVRFGSFHVLNKNARPGRNPKTGETVNIPAKKVVTFKVSNKLKEAINGIFER